MLTLGELRKLVKNPMESVQKIPSWKSLRESQEKVTVSKNVRGKMILQSYGKEFFTCHGKEFFT